MRWEYQTNNQSPSLNVGAIEFPETLTVPNLLTNSSLAHKLFAYFREKGIEIALLKETIK
jgi:hypothetical protein